MYTFKTKEKIILESVNLLELKIGMSSAVTFSEEYISRQCCRDTDSLFSWFHWKNPCFCISGNVAANVPASHSCDRSSISIVASTCWEASSTGNQFRSPVAVCSRPLMHVRFPRYSSFFSYQLSFHGNTRADEEYW